MGKAKRNLPRFPARYLAISSPRVFNGITLGAAGVGAGALLYSFIKYRVTREPHYTEEPLLSDRVQVYPIYGQNRAGIGLTWTV